MFNYTRRLKLAVGDTVRRSVLRIVAGAVIAVGAGFLIAALWSWLAIGLGWGATYASLTIGGGLLVIGGIIMLVAAKPHHHMPSSDELKREVEAQVNYVADAAANRARYEANRMVGMAENKVYGLFGGAGEQVRRSMKGAGRVSHKVADASNSNTGNMVKLAAAFAVGAVLASKLRGQNDESDET